MFHLCVAARLLPPDAPASPSPRSVVAPQAMQFRIGSTSKPNKPSMSMPLNTPVRRTQGTIQSNKTHRARRAQGRSERGNRLKQLNWNSAVTQQWHKEDQATIVDALRVRSMYSHTAIVSVRLPRLLRTTTLSGKGAWSLFEFVIQDSMILCKTTSTCHTVGGTRALCRT